MSEFKRILPALIGFALCTVLALVTGYGVMLFGWHVIGLRGGGMFALTVSLAAVLFVVLVKLEQAFRNW